MVQVKVRQISDMRNHIMWIERLQEIVDRLELPIRRITRSRLKVLYETSTLLVVG